MKKKILNHIQFLRGFSVILVFFYHLKLQYFDYGFLGVDIFFVISGFVITSLIYSEIESTKKFNFLNFYIKRFKRIFPVLFFVISISLLFIVFFQPLDLFLNNLRVYFLSLIGISNFYYLFSKKNYFDTVFDDPFAHTWSLGVEEQFYIIFPLFLFLLLNIKSYFKFIFFIIFIIILGLSFSIFFQENIKLIFYSPLFRFWEFLVGTLTFFLSNKIKFKNNNLSLLILIILIIFILIPKNISLPIITIATCLLASIFILIYEKKKIVNLIIENRLFIFLGNISYSFYLWHLPVIYFYDLYFLKSFLRVPLLFFLIVILSYFSFIYVENKFRYLKINVKFSLKNNVIIGITILSLVLLINIIAFKDSYESPLKYKFKNLVYHLNYLERKINYSDRVIFYKFNISGNQIYRFCTEEAKSFKSDKNNLRIECLKKGKNENRIFYIVGNSHTANFIPMFNEIDINDSIYYSHKINPLENIDFVQINNLKKNYKNIIFTTNISDFESLDKLKNIQKKFNQDIKILILGAIPNVNNNIEPLKCLIRNVDCIYDTNLNRKRIKFLNSKITQLINYNTNFNYFNPYNIICPNKICKVFDKEKNLITHRDASHLTSEGSILMKKKFMNFYNKTYNKND
mgnify:CR=1 FL=1